MGASTGIRLLLGLATFATLARLLGPASFGVFMFWMAVATLISLLSNYGFTPFVLREIGRRPGDANLIMSEVMTAKLLITSVLVVALVAGVLLMGNSDRLVFLLLTLALLVDSLTDFLNVGYRATNRFGSETRIATVAACLQFVIVVGGTWYTRSAIFAAAFFLISRVLVLLVTWRDQLAFFSDLRLTSVRSAMVTLRSALNFAYDFVLQSLLGQVDSLVLNQLMGPVAVGMHQAGMRLFLGGAQIANILGNVFIPRLANSHQTQSGKFAKQATQLQTAFIASGAAFGLTLTLAASPIVHILFGHEYEALVPLLPWFGLLFFVRFLAASYGLLLTAVGRQSFRAGANLLHWLVIFAAAWALVPVWGNVGWIAALTAGNALLVVLYGFASFRSVKPHLTNLGLASGLLALFPAFLTIPK